MARLADALQRASRGRGEEGAPPTPSSIALEPVARPLRARVTEGLERFERIDPGPGGTPLLAFPSERAMLDGWRTDPELVGKLVGTEGVSSGALEQYRKLAATLHHAQTERGIQVVMTASSLPGEGKSLTATNLALTLSESYHRRVFLVDADLRRPTVQRLFGLPTLNGLDEGLKAEHDRPMSVIQLSERLFVLPAGRPDPDPLSGLTSDRMKRLVHQARSAFDWVVIDTPPVTLLPDANLLAACVDGVLLVVRAGKAPFQLVKRTVDTLGHERILGIVMNAVDYAHDRNAGGYYEYYGYGYYGVSKSK
ncbi:MAG: CpsD/CapB family tyrosine-protein kinase [Vicinamibacterales bacterium]|jgi:capsular exopolysaccharide synthesis family protein